MNCGVSADKELCGLCNTHAGALLNGPSLLLTGRPFRYLDRGPVQQRVACMGPYRII